MTPRLLVPVLGGLIVALLMLAVANGLGGGWTLP
jgi:hypothetical protein